MISIYKSVVFLYTSGKQLEIFLNIIAMKKGMISKNKSDKRYVKLYGERDILFWKDKRCSIEMQGIILSCIGKLNITNVYTSDNFMYIFNAISIEISSVFCEN